MRKIIMVLLVIIFAVSLLMAAPVKNRNAANCIKRYYETYGKYNFGKNRITNATVGCKDGSPTVTYWDNVKRQRSGVWAWLGSFGVKAKQACPVNPCK